MRFLQIASRSLRLRCPACGKERLYCGLFKMRETCPNCGLSFQREQGFYLGAIYFNYGATALVVTIAYPLLVFTKTLTPNQALTVCMGFVGLFPIFFFRFARSLWIGFDELIDPQPPTSPKP